MSKPTLRIHTHWQVAQSHLAIQNLPKSMAAPTHGRQESAANLKGNNTDENERQCTTRSIKHWDLSGYASRISRIKVYCTLIVKWLRTPQRFHTPIRCAQLKRETAIVNE